MEGSCKASSFKQTFAVSGTDTDQVIAVYTSKKLYCEVDTHFS